MIHSLVLNIDLSLLPSLKFKYSCRIGTFRMNERAHPPPLASFHPTPTPLPPPLPKTEEIRIAEATQRRESTKRKKRRKGK